MRTRTAPADSGNSIRNHLKRIQATRAQEILIRLLEAPDNVTPAATAWRDTIDSLQRELEIQAKYIQSLKAKKTDTAKAKETRFLESVYQVTKQIGEEIRSLIHILKSLTTISRNSRFQDWDLIIEDLRSEISKIFVVANTEGPEESLGLLVEIWRVRDQIMVEIFEAMIHKKLVLWMDLGIVQDGYVKGQILSAIQWILEYQENFGYIPTKTEYEHPNVNEGFEKESKGDFVPMVENLSDQFTAIIRLVENNFKLSSKEKHSPMAVSLREQIEIAKKQAEQFDKELRQTRSIMKEPDRREWIEMSHDLEDIRSLYEISNKNALRLEMEKNNLQAEKMNLSLRLRESEAELKTLGSTVLPRLDDLERNQQEVLLEMKKIRQDADLLPEMFRNEVKMKKMIREEKLEAEQKREEALLELKKIQEGRQSLIREKERQSKISIHAISARNMIDKTLKETQEKIKHLETDLKKATTKAEEAVRARDYYKEEYQDLQTNIYSLNNRINELEDEKKILLDQLEKHGIQSKAHYAHRKLGDHHKEEMKSLYNHRILGLIAISGEILIEHLQAMSYMRRATNIEGETWNSDADDAFDALEDLALRNSGDSYIAFYIISVILTVGSLAFYLIFSEKLHKENITENSVYTLVIWGLDHVVFGIGFVPILSKFVDSWYCDINNEMTSYSEVECWDTEHWILVGLGEILVGVVLFLAGVVFPTLKNERKGIELKWENDGYFPGIYKILILGVATALTNIQRPLYGFLVTLFVILYLGIYECYKEIHVASMRMAVLFGEAWVFLCAIETDDDGDLASDMLAGWIPMMIVGYFVLYLKKLVAKREFSVVPIEK